MTAPVPPSGDPPPDGVEQTSGSGTEGFEVRLEQQDLYRFLALFDQDGVGPLAIDEPPPLGAGDGPNASRLLATAVGHCLSASSLFCLNKARVPVHGVHTTVTGEYQRNERGRLRIGGLKVHLHLDVDAADRPRMSRCLSLFEDFCVVTASVRDGIDVAVEVDTGDSAGSPA
ncbi:MAG: OsmC family protein [Acidobacteriota bacterium]|nr:OsmC family protein [Acidobacteriota bacterium]